MKKLLTGLFVCCLLAFTSQTSKADDDILLKSDFKNAYTTYTKALNTEKSPLNYLNMCKLAYLLRDDENAKIYCRDSLKEIEKEKNPDLELKSEILSMMGSIYSTVYHNREITFDYLNKAKEYKESIPDTDKYGLIKLYRNIAYSYNYEGNANLAQKYWDKALNLAQEEAEEKYKPMLAVIYNDLAMFERKNQKYDKSKEYLDKAIKAAQEAGEYENHSVNAIIYENLATYYEINKRDKKTAENYYKKALKENSMYPEKDLLTKEEVEMPEGTTIEDITEKLNDYPYDIDLNVMAGSYYMMTDKKKAEEYFNKAIKQNPNNTYVYAGIASAYAEKYANAQFKDYLEGAKKYIELTNKQKYYEPDIYLTLGVINLNLNAVINANMYFSEYIKYSENKASAQCEVASAFWYNDTKIKYRKYVIYYLEKARKTIELNAMYKMMLIESYKQIGKSKKADDLAADLIKEDGLFEE